MYRPDNWKNLFSPAAVTVRDRNNKPISHYDAYEYGADAMLEALIKNGIHKTKTGRKWSTEAFRYQAGWMVFIPDKE